MVRLSPSADRVHRDPPQRPVEPDPRPSRTCSVDSRPAGPRSLAWLFARFMWVKPGLDQPGRQHGGGAEGVAVRAGRGGDRIRFHLFRSRSFRRCSFGVRGTRHFTDVPVSASTPSKFPTTRSPREAGARSIEQAASAVRRDAVGKGHGAQVDVPDEGEAHRRVQTGWGRRGRLEQR